MGKKGSDKVRAKSKVLGDHKRVGTRFVPPLLQTLNLESVTWVDQILPEILWIGLLQSRLGTARGTETALRLAQAASKVGDSLHLYALTSSYSSLTAEQRAHVLGQTRAAGLLADLMEGLWPLIRFYPQCPLSFVSDGSVQIVHDPATGLDEFKSVLLSLFDRSGVPATLMQASAVYLGFRTGKLFVMEGLSISNLAPIEQYPHTEESRRVAAGVRASTTALCGPERVDPTWSRLFWNRGLELEKCECRLLWGE